VDDLQFGKVVGSGPPSEQSTTGSDNCALRRSVVVGLFIGSLIGVTASLHICNLRYADDVAFYTSRDRYFRVEMSKPTRILVTLWKWDARLGNVVFPIGWLCLLILLYCPLWPLKKMQWMSACKARWVYSGVLMTASLAAVVAIYWASIEPKTNALYRIMTET